MKSSTTIHALSTRVAPADWWTGDLVRAAHLAADRGSFRLAAELCDVLLADDRVQGCMLALTRGFFGLELNFEEGVGRLKRRAVRALEVQEDWWYALPEEELSQLVAWGVMFGIGLGHLTWSMRNGRLVPRLEVWHPKHLRFDTHARSWHLETATGEIQIKPGDGEWVMYTPGGSLRPWSHGAWRSIARWWLLKRYALSDWARHSEQAGGVKVATTDSGNEADRRKLAADLQATGADAAIALPKGWSLDLIEVTANTFETFRAQVDSANAAIAIALVGQNLSTEVKGGSLAAAEVHQSVQHAVIRGQAETLSTCLHDQVLALWAVYNFGNAQVAPWPRWNTQPPADHEALAKTHATVIGAIALAHDKGLRVDFQALCEEYGIPLEEEASKPGASAFVEQSRPEPVTTQPQTATQGDPQPLAQGTP